jgi:hypothetical protein
MRKSERFLMRAALLPVFLLLVLLAVPSRAYGYIDPGSGSAVYQAVYAALLGGAFYFRKVLQRLFRRDK